MYRFGKEAAGHPFAKMRKRGFFQVTLESRLDDERRRKRYVGLHNRSKGRKSRFREQHQE
jgi:hypothetical protein